MQKQVTNKSSVAMSKTSGQNNKVKQKSLKERHNEILKNMMDANIMKPTNVEAQRILKICEQWVINVEILQYVNKDMVSRFYMDQQEIGKTNQIQEHFNTMKHYSGLSGQTQKLLVRQARAEHNYAELQMEQEMSEKNAKQNRSREEDDDYLEDEIIDEEERLREEQERQTRRTKRAREFERNSKIIQENGLNLIRSIRQNQNDYIIIKNGCQNEPEAMSDILQCVRSIHIIMQKKLSTAAEEEEQKTNQLSELEDRINTLQETKKTVQEELDNVKSERQRYNKEKKQEIDNLKKQLQDVNQMKKDKIDSLRKRKEQNLDHMQQEFQKKQEQLKAEITQFSQQFLTQKKTNETNEDKLKKKKLSLESQCSEGFSSYDQMMQKYKEDKKGMLENYNKIKTELKDLQEHFREVEIERKKEEEVEKEIQAKKDAYYLNKKRQIEAARRIQIAYRTYKAKSGKKKKKKKKKK